MAKVDQTGAFADYIEQIAMLSGGRVVLMFNRT
jgi:hypothetical protein